MAASPGAAKLMLTNGIQDVCNGHLQLICIICDTSRFPAVAPLFPHGCYPAAVSAFLNDTRYVVGNQTGRFTW
jgi:hypothetical protein